MSQAGAPLRLGDYELESELGRGGVGRVYRAREKGTGATRAVKVLDGSVDLELVERFQREASALGRLGGEGVVRIHHSGSERGRPYLVMDLMSGGSLRDRIRSSPNGIPWRDAAVLVARLARTLGRCAELGLVHRDVKPENVLFDGKGEAFLADFGCVRDLSRSRMTATGTFMGTPGYMAPEQLDGSAVEAAADVYALGVILQELVTGRRPFAGESLVALARAIRAGRRSSLQEGTDAPRELEQLARRALALEPGARPGAAELAAALEAVASGEATVADKAATPARSERQRLRLLLGGLVLVAGGLALAVAVTLGRSPSKAPEGSLEDALAAVRSASEPFRPVRVGLPASGSLAAVEAAVAGLEGLADRGRTADPARREARSLLASCRVEACLAAHDPEGARRALGGLEAGSPDRELLEAVLALASGGGKAARAHLDPLLAGRALDPRLRAEATLVAARERLLDGEDGAATDMLSRLEAPERNRPELASAADLLRHALRAAAGATSDPRRAFAAAENEIAPVDSALASHVLRACALEASRRDGDLTSHLALLEEILDRDPDALAQEEVARALTRVVAALEQADGRDTLDETATAYVLANAADPEVLAPEPLYEALCVTLDKDAVAHPDVALAHELALVKLGREPHAPEDDRARQALYDRLAAHDADWRASGGWPQKLALATLGPKLAGLLRLAPERIKAHDVEADALLGELAGRRLPRQARALVPWLRAQHAIGNAADRAAARALLRQAIDLGWGRPDRAWLELAQLELQDDPARALAPAAEAAKESEAMFGLASSMNASGKNPHARGCALWPDKKTEEVLVEAKVIECTADISLGAVAAFDAASAELADLKLTDPLLSTLASVESALVVTSLLKLGKREEAGRILADADYERSTVADRLVSIAGVLGHDKPFHGLVSGYAARAYYEMYQRGVGCTRMLDAVHEMEIARSEEQRGTVSLSHALRAWSRVIDSCRSTDEERASALKNIERLRERGATASGESPAADLVAAKPWRIEVLVFRRTVLGGVEQTAPEDAVTALRAGFASLEGHVFEATRHCRRIELAVQDVPAPVKLPGGHETPLDPRDLPYPFDAKAIEQGRWDSVFCYVLRGGEPVAPVRIDAVRLGAPVTCFDGLARPTGRAGDAEIRAWLADVRECLLDVQGWPRWIVPKDDARLEEAATDVMWLTASPHDVADNPWNGGDVRRWRVTGPQAWTGGRADGLRVAVAGATAVVETPERALHIERVSAGHTDGKLAALAETWVKVPSEQSVQLLVGSDDGCRVFVNDARVFEHAAPRPLRLDEDRIAARLRRGWNHVAIQVENQRDELGVSLRIWDVKGGPPRGLVLSAEPPGPND